MKALKKLMLTGVILGVVSLMATSVAFAEETAVYDASAKKVTVAGVDYNAYADGSQLAIVIVPTSAYTSGSIASATEDNIYYIDQAGKSDAASSFANLFVKEGFAAIADEQAEVKEYADGSYVAIIGSNDETQDLIVIDVTLPTLGGGSTHEVQLGNADLDSKVDALDASLIINVSAGMADELEGDAKIAANADCDSKIDALDASLVINVSAGMADPLGVVVVDDATGEVVE